MKIRIELESDLKEEEVVIRCNSLNDTVTEIQRVVSEVLADKKSWYFTKGETTYYISLEDILFFDSSPDGICVHTRKDMYETKYKLYELEERLPGYFMRISKSTILNVRQVYAVTRNLTASSAVEFAGTNKQVYVSRHYYKALRSRLDERYEE